MPAAYRADSAHVVGHSIEAHAFAEFSGITTLTLPGDLTGDEQVNNEDVSYLLWHTLFPDEFPISNNADFTGDGQVNNADVSYLFWHTLFPEEFPL